MKAKNVAWAAVLGISIVGCARKKAMESLEPIAPTGEQRQVLRIEGIEDPYSKRGQDRLRKLEYDRKEIQKLQDAKRKAISERRGR